MSRTHCERTSPSAPIPTSIHSEIDALHVVATAIADLAEPQVIAVITRRRQSDTIMVVDGTHPADAVLGIAELVGVTAADEGVDDAEVVLASVRPDGSDDADDLVRWKILDALCEESGVELLDWFVLTPYEYWSPRALAGEPERW